MEVNMCHLVLFLWRNDKLFSCCFTSNPKIHSMVISRQRGKTLFWWNHFYYKRRGFNGTTLVGGAGKPFFSEKCSVAMVYSETWVATLWCYRVPPTLQTTGKTFLSGESPFSQRVLHGANLSSHQWRNEKHFDELKTHTQYIHSGSVVRLPTAAQLY